MKKLLLSTFTLISLFASAQNKDKEKHAIDVDAIRQTELTGDIGLRPTIMSVPANPDKVAAYIRKFPAKKFLTFPEKRENSIRLLDAVPERWLSYSAQQLTSFSANANPGEYFVFQVGIFASGQSLENIKVQLSPLSSKGGSVIKEVTCFNAEGISFQGDYFKKPLNLTAKKVLPLWFGVQIPADATGPFNGKIEIKADGVTATVINVQLNVSGAFVENHGYNNQNSLSRLAWLNSRIGLDDDITSGYKQVVRNQKNIAILGRDITLTAEGLPATIDTYFDHNNEKILPVSEPILAKPLAFIVAQNGKPLTFKAGKTVFQDHLPGATSWVTKLSNEAVVITLKGRAEYDGYIGYSAIVTPLKDTPVDDIRLEIPLRPEKATYMMGLDKEGGFAPKEWNWRWDVINKHQDEVWMGAVNGGLKVKLKGKNYRRQLVNIYYPFGPLKEPESWGNNHAGGVTIGTADNAVNIKAFSGKRMLKKGQAYQFDFELLVTPFKLINRDVQFNDRYYQSDIDTSVNFIKTAVDHGANIITIHHKKDLYPFIDYPFHEENVPDLKAFIDKTHEKGLQTKIYYTTRELTVNAPELWAMRALDNEIIYPGPGMATRSLVNPKGVHPWLGQNLKENFIPGWVATFTAGKYKGRQDLAILTTPDSRLNNFFLEGLDWMTKNLKIDGIYMDDLALDRETMKRTRKVLDRERPGAKIDMHTWNHFNDYAKWASSLNLYMDMLPFIDQLWVGEARDYNRSPDYWLIEVSGVPFGLTSQMLNRGGNKWRGMTFGITDRLGWFRSTTPEYIWKFWDEYHIDKKQMIGFWNDEIPVKSDNADTKATIYQSKDEVIIALANWTDKPQKCRLNIDWAALGLTADGVTAEIPAILEYQDAKSINIKNELELEPEKGFLIVLKKK
jgi:hypothetical protein